ncbi:MAG: ATP-binding cassette domain-containing protein [Egibacteraceae bacterium]
MDHELAIRASGLVKHFGDVKAVDGVDLAVRRGGVYGFLGPNGAGKTTTIRMLATLLRPDSGTAKVLGHDITSEAALVRRRVSLTGQFASVDEDLTGVENLVLLARLLGRSRGQSKARAGELLEAFGLADAAGSDGTVDHRPRRRPGRVRAPAAALTFGWRALLKIKHVPEQLFDVTMFPIMFPIWQPAVIVGALLGDALRYSLASATRIQTS